MNEETLPPQAKCELLPVLAPQIVDLLIRVRPNPPLLTHSCGTGPPPHLGRPIQGSLGTPT